MGFFRMIFYGILAYAGYKMVKGMVAFKSSDQNEVQGKRKDKPLDLKQTDIQDARFKDIDEKKDTKA